MLSNRILNIASMLRKPLIASFALISVGSTGLNFLLSVSMVHGTGLAVLGISMGLPALVLAIAGSSVAALSGRLGPHVVLRGSLATMATAAALAGAADASGLAWRGWVEALALLCSGIAAAAAAVSVMILVPRVLPNELETANAALQGTSAACQILTPLVLVLVRQALSASVALFMVALLLAGGTWHSNRSVDGSWEQESTSLRAALFAGGRVIGRSADLRRMTLGLAIAWSGLGAVSLLEIPLLMDQLRGGAQGYASVLSACAFGALIGSLVFGLAGPRMSGRGPLALLLGTSGLLWGIYGLSGSVQQALAVAIAASVLGAGLNIATASTIQRATAGTEDESSVVAWIFGSFHATGALSLLAAGLVAGPVLSITNSLLLCGGLGLLGALLLPRGTKRDLGITTQAANVTDPYLAGS